MTKKRTLNREAHYKSIIDKQKKIIQELKKKVSRSHKLEDRYNDLEERETELALLESTEHLQEEQKRFGCPKCNGELYVIDGGRRKVYICQDCNYKASKNS